MATKQFNARQIQKHDTEANWDLTNGFIPFDGEIIIYDKDNTHDKPRMKAGDGVTDVKLLPFASGAVESVNNKTGVVTITKSDVGLGNVDNVQQYSASNPPPYPVTSVNSKTGTVTLSASDVGAIPSSEKGVASGVATLDSSEKVPYYQLAGSVSGLDTSRVVPVYKHIDGITSWDSVVRVISESNDPLDYPMNYALYTWIKKIGNEAVSSPESMVRASFTSNVSMTTFNSDSQIFDILFGQPVQRVIRDTNDTDEISILFDNGYVSASQNTYIFTINGISHLNISGTIVDIQMSMSGLNDSGATTTITLTAIAHETKVIADPTSPSATPLVMPMVPAPVSGTLTLSSSSWTDNLDGTYSQSITITGSTNYSKIDLQPNAAVLSQLSADGVGAIYVTNQNNVLSAIAVGNAPTANLSVQYVMSAVYDGAIPSGGGSTPQVVSITMPASWTDNSDGTYSQVITSLITTAGATVTEYSKVDTQVTSAVVSQLTGDGVTGLYAQQNNGAVTMIAMGAEPSSTVTVQLTITETNVI